MPVLMLISGFMLRNVITERHRVVNRLLDYLWLLLIWTPVAASQRSIAGVANEIILPQSGLWFLWINGLILGVIAITPMAYRTITTVILMIVAAIAAVLSRVPAVGALLEQQVAGPGALLPLCVLQAMHYAIFFLIGLVAVRWIERELTHVSWHRFFAWFGFLVASAVTIAVSPIFGIMLGVATSFASVHLFSLTAWIAPTRILAATGRITLPIYLCHYTILRLLHHIAGEATASWQIIGLTAASIGGSLGAYRLARAVGAEWLFRRPSFTAARWPRLAGMPLPGLR